MSNHRDCSYSNWKVREYLQNCIVHNTAFLCEKGSFKYYQKLNVVGSPHQVAIASKMKIHSYEKIPEPWEELGMDWGLSFSQMWKLCLHLFGEE